MNKKLKQYSVQEKENANKKRKTKIHENRADCRREREREGSKKIKTSLKSIISFCKHELVLLNI